MASVACEKARSTTVEESHDIRNSWLPKVAAAFYFAVMASMVATLVWMALS